MTTSPDLPARLGTGPQAGAPTQVADLPAHPGTGLLISVEGGDGVGKTTQIGLLEAVLKEAGVEYVLTREPGGTELGASIRRLLLHGGYVSPRAEALLYAADRAHHVATCILPALERGAVVLTDRYLDSSVAYQGAARDLGPQEVRDLSLWATGSLLPELTVLLDADPALTVRRARSRGLGDRIEQESDSFRATLRREFLDLAAADTVLNWFAQIAAEGATLLMVTHDPQAAARAGSVLVMDSGRIAAHVPGGSAEAVSRAILEIRGRAAA